MKFKTANVFEDFNKDNDLYDFSNYPKDSKFNDHSNMNKMGKMKDESKGKIIIEFVGLNPNIYSLIYVDSKENKRGK